MYTQEHTQVRTQEQSSVTVHQAARELGITEVAVRARLRRGQLSGEKRGKAWVVFLDDNQVHTSGTYQDTHPGTHQVHTPTQPGGQADQAELIAELRQQQAALQADKAYLQATLTQTLAQLAAERERADVLQLTASAGVRQEPSGAPRSDDTQLSGLWARVRRWLTSRGKW